MHFSFGIVSKIQKFSKMEYANEFKVRFDFNRNDSKRDNKNKNKHQCKNLQEYHFPVSRPDVFTASK